MQDRRRLVIRLVYIVTITLCLIWIVHLIRSIDELRARSDIVRLRQNELHRLQKERSELERDLEYVRSPEYIEQQARDKLGLAREGDTVILFGSSSGITKPPPPDNQTQQQMLSAPSESLPVWEEWVRLFL